MGKAAEFIESFLAHYASEYYDPAKAREYYLRTRELKGRRSGSDLKTDSKKQAWAYAKNKITEERKELLKETGNEFRADIQLLRDTAMARRKELSNKLSLLLKKATEIRQHDAGVISEKQKKEMEKISEQLERQLERVTKTAQKQSEKLTEQQEKERKRISDEASRKIAALPPVPKGLSDERRAELAAERSEQIAKIRGDATKDRKSLSDAVRTQRKAISEQADGVRESLRNEADTQREAISKQTSAQRENLSKWSTADKAKHRERTTKEREAVGAELKAVVDRGRAGYEQAKERIKAQYEQKLDTEYEAIRANV